MMVRGRPHRLPGFHRTRARRNNDLVLVIRDRAILKADGRSFDVIRDQHAKPLKRMP